jgi:hypothetical protein
MLGLSCFWAVAQGLGSSLVLSRQDKLLPSFSPRLQEKTRRRRTNEWQGEEIAAL